MTTRLAAAHTPDEVAVALADAVVDVLRVEFAGVALVGGGHARGLAARHEGRPVDWWGELRVPLAGEGSPIATAVSDAAPVVVTELESTAVGAQLARAVGAEAAAFLPLFAAGSVIGVVAAATGRSRTFDGEEIARAGQIAAHGALALAAAGTAAELELAFERERLAVRVGRLLREHAELRAALEVAARETAETLALARCVVRLDAGLAVAADSHPEDSAAGRVADVAPLAELAARERRLVAIADVPAAPELDAAARDALVALGTRAVLAAPISTSGGVVGVLELHRREPEAWRDGEVALAETLANQIGSALGAAPLPDEGRGRGTGRAHAAALTALYRVTAALGQPLSLAATRDAVAEAATEAVVGTAAVLLEARGDALELVGRHALPDEVAGAFGERVRSDRVLLAAAREGRLVAASALADDDRFGEGWRSIATRAGYRSLVAVPLASAAATPALALVLFAEERALSDEEVELAQQFAAAAEAALERSAGSEEERNARSLAHRLAQLAGVLARELEPTAVLDELARQAPRLLEVSASAVRVVDEDALVVGAVEGPGTDLLVGARSSSSSRLSGDVLQSRSPLAIEDTAGDDRLRAADPLLETHRAYLGVPLAAPDGALRGVLAVYAREPRRWRADEVEALASLATNATIALANAELYQRVAFDQERSFAILANVADGIVAIDRDGRVVLWNRAAEQITGVPTEEALGRTPQQVLGRNLESDGARPPGDRLVSIVRGGEEVWLSLTEAVMHDPLGVVAGRIYAFRDISADRLVEQMKSEFVSTISQELRRPLTSIYGFAETLLREDVLFGEEERRTFLEYIARESERLTTIVDALLNVARLDTGDLKVEVSPTDVGSVVPDVVSAARASDRVDGHRFVLDLPDEPLRAEADAEKLRQVLSILVDNAVKFSPEGATVTVAARRRSDAIEVSVVDEGVGIPPAEQERIFRKFYRRDVARPGAAGGTGLGLFIAQGLVSAMGGRIWVESREGEGSSFTFELPLAREPAGVPA